ncbi:MAG: glutathione S-transferase N-terminal domain-containing protein [Pseudomonadota bacterium]
MKLYAMPGTCALAPNIASLWAELPTEVVNLKRGDHRKDAYLSINPRGQVPSLVFENGQVLTEAAAILLFIAASARQPSFVPSDPPRLGATGRGAFIHDV